MKGQQFKLIYMLDTNIIIFTMRHKDSVCARRVASHLGNDICISAITYGELEFGICNSGQPARSREAVNRILAGIPILSFDLDAAVHFGEILAELKIKNRFDVYRDRDKMIAAHARAKGYVLVTDNIKDFSYIDALMLENWRTPGDLSPDKHRLT